MKWNDLLHDIYTITSRKNKLFILFRKEEENEINN